MLDARAGYSLFQLFPFPKNGAEYSKVIMNIDDYVLTLLCAINST